MVYLFPPYLLDPRTSQNVICVYSMSVHTHSMHAFAREKHPCVHPSKRETFLPKTSKEKRKTPSEKMKMTKDADV